MSALRMKRIAGSLATLAVAAALAGAPQAVAMGGGRGGSNDIGFEGAAARGAAGRASAPTGDARGVAHVVGGARGEAAGGPLPVHDPARPHRAGDYFQDARAPDALLPDGPVVYGGVIPVGERPYDPAFADHRLIGPIFDEVRRDWPVDFLFGPQMYGAGDFQHCMRRDVYGDPYRAC